MIRIYSKPDCAKCHMLKTWCDKNAIKYEVADISTDLDAHAEIASRGLMALPVVQIDSEFYNGDVVKLMELLKNRSN